MKSGVYQIRNLYTGACYIGSARNFVARWAEHRRDLQQRVHNNKHLQHAWDKYGADTFEFSVVLYCAPTLLLQHEQQLLDSRQPEYNIARSARAPFLGRKHTPESLAKISAGNKGKIISREQAERHGALLRGRQHTSEHRAKVSAALMGNTRRKGKKYGPMSAAHKAKISAALTGRTCSPQHRANISVAKRKNPC